MATTLFCNVSGVVPIRTEAFGLMVEFARTMNEVVAREAEYDFPERSRLSPAQLETRAWLIRKTAGTKAAAQAVQNALADWPSSLLPEFRVDPPAAGGARKAAMTVMGGDELVNLTLDRVIDWALQNVSDAPYGWYTFEMRESSTKSPETHLIASSYTIITREDHYRLGSGEEFNAKMVVLNRQHAAATQNHDISHLEAVIERCKDLHGEQFFVEGGCAVLAALLAQAAQSKGESGDFVLLIRENEDGETWLSHICYHHHPSNRVIDITAFDRADELWMDNIALSCAEMREPEPEFRLEAVEASPKSDILSTLRQLIQAWRLNVNADWLDRHYETLAQATASPVSASGTPLSLHPSPQP